VSTDIRGTAPGNEAGATNAQRQVPDRFDPEPTALAQVVFVEHSGATTSERSLEPVRVRTPIDQPTGPDPTQWAQAEFVYREREFRTTFRVPGQHTDRLLDMVTFGVGVGGLAGLSFLAFRWSALLLPPAGLIALCGGYLLVFGLLTVGALFRRRRKG
jgi:hypothetical protein